MSRRLRVAVLGATGSIGGNTLDVMARHPERFEVTALSANSQVDALFDLCRLHRPRWAILSGPQDALALESRLRQQGLPTQVLHGEAALEQVAGHADVDAVMAAIVGAAGLRPCLAAARAGKRLMLANKEALVVGGAFFMQAVEQGGATLLPVDSEHSAIFQCLPLDRASWPQTIDHLVLTASGGPFRRRDPDSLHAVTPDEACAHPNWVMGRKISVDSATMMNKGLELIEAHWLFGLPAERLKVLIHPQSIVHSMVVCRDQSVLAQLGTPDMRVPIAYALSYPERIESGAAPLNLLEVAALQFEAPDLRRFPALALAWDALRGPEGATAVLNAANEVAVAAFLGGQLRFTDVAGCAAQALQSVCPAKDEVASVDGLMHLDARARRAAEAWVAAR
jgi:1-deoxy-D-xylulose-5-phosphate reductoisomerase